MNTYKVRTQSDIETKDIAEKLARNLNQGDVITLEGTLGAGKTTFTKGIAKGLGVKRVVTSPTFTILKQYSGTVPLYHIDAYRLEHSDEDIGFDEYFYGNGVTVIEWAKYIVEYLPEDRLNITINYIDEFTREIIFQPDNEHYQTVLKNMNEIEIIEN